MCFPAIKQILQEICTHHPSPYCINWSNKWKTPTNCYRACFPLNKTLPLFFCLTYHDLPFANMPGVMRVLHKRFEYWKVDDASSSFLLPCVRLFQNARIPYVAVADMFFWRGLITIMIIMNNKAVQLAFLGCATRT